MEKSEALVKKHKRVETVPGEIEQLKADLEKAKGFIRHLVLAHKATKDPDHYQTTGDARRFIGME